MPEKATTTATRSIHRMTWESVLDGKVQERLNMDLLPETYSVDEPARISVTQTRGAGYIDSFGMGFGTISMSGTTGYARRRNANKGRNPSDLVDGYERWYGLRDFFYRFLKQAPTAPASTFYMNFYNWPQEDYYLVFPAGVPQLQRSVSQPLLYRYNLQMTLLYRMEDTPYDLNKVEALREDTITQLATLGPQRVGVIADQIDANLANMWTVFSKSVLNVVDPAAQIGTFFPGLAQSAQDAAVQTYIDQLQQRNKPAGYVLPTDNSQSLIARTRTLSQHIHDFSSGAVTVVDSTLQEVRNLTGYWRDVLDAVEYTLNIPADFARSLKETMCGVQSLQLYPNLFRSTVSQSLTDITSLLLDSGCATTLRF
jgi:hypothetical protein